MPDQDPDQPWNFIRIFFQLCVRILTSIMCSDFHFNYGSGFWRQLWIRILASITDLNLGFNYGSGS